MIKSEQVRVRAAAIYENAARGLIKPSEGAFLVGKAVCENIVAAAVDEPLCGGIGDVGVIVVVDCRATLILGERGLMEYVVRDGMRRTRRGKHRRSVVEKVVMEFAETFPKHRIDAIKNTVRKVGPGIIDEQTSTAELTVGKANRLAIVKPYVPVFCSRCRHAEFGEANLCGWIRLGGSAGNKEDRRPPAAPLFLHKVVTQDSTRIGRCSFTNNASAGGNE